jgi:hypothetical protein
MSDVRKAIIATYAEWTAMSALPVYGWASGVSSLIGRTFWTARIVSVR